MTPHWRACVGRVRARASRARLNTALKMFATRTHSPITPARDAAVRATFTPFGLMDKENVPPAWLAVRADDDDDDGEKARVIAVPVGRDGECGETRRKSRTPSRPVLVDITRRFTPLEVR